MYLKSQCRKKNRKTPTYTQRRRERGRQGGRKEEGRDREKSEKQRQRQKKSRKQRQNQKVMKTYRHTQRKREIETCRGKNTWNENKIGKERKKKREWGLIQISIITVY